jgi:hypothetical protein
VTRIVQATTVGVVLALSLTALAQTAARRDGRWEVRTEMSMPGMTMPPMTVTQCVTKEEAADPQKSLPQSPGQNKCTVSDYKSDGDKITWKVTCQGPGAMSGTGEAVYKSDTFESVMNMESAGQKMTMKATGKRLGDCEK